MILEHIFTSPHPGAAQVPCEQVRAVAGQGLEGDRYFGQAARRGRNVTLIEAEQLEAFLHQLGLPCDLSATRRNLVTRGVRLNELVGRDLLVGPVRLRGVELCEPCMELGRALTLPPRTPAEVMKLLMGRTGLRADILSTGVISVGARVHLP